MDRRQTHHLALIGLRDAADMAAGSVLKGTNPDMAAVLRELAEVIDASRDPTDPTLKGRTMGERVENHVYTISTEALLVEIERRVLSQASGAPVDKATSAAMQMTIAYNGIMRVLAMFRHSGSTK